MNIRDKKKNERIQGFNTVHEDLDQAKEIDFHRQMNGVNNQNHSEQIV
jgi:hypothetical protein